MKRIALELQPCCWNRSGIGTYTYEIAKRLHDDEELEFHGNIFNFCGKHDYSEALSEIDMPIYTNKFLTYGVYRRIWNHVPLSYKNVFHKTADLSIFFNFIVPPRIQGRVLTVVHDLTYLRYPETMKKTNFNHIHRGIRYSVERSDKVLTVSEFSKQEIHELLGVSKEKINVIYNAPSLSLQSAPYNMVKEKYNIEKPYILFVSTIEPRKNIVRLMKAFSILKKTYQIPHQLVLAGGKGWQDKEIFQVVRELEFSEDILFTGYVTALEKNTLYQNADIFIFPSVYEGFGIPPLEAMSWGCPVVCSDVASLPEVVGNAAEMINPFEEESIAQGILNVLSDSFYKDSLIEKGYQNIKRFTWENSAEKLTKLCKELLL